MPPDASRSAEAAQPHAAAIQALAVVERALATCCPRCGAAVLSAASDFCEHCAAHLYPGHCVFCLTPFAPDQPYCRSCGLPPDGVTCGACGTFSRFDFCPNPDCGAGLTPRAAEELARLDSDPDAIDAFAQLDEIDELLQSLGSDMASVHAPRDGATRVPSPDMRADVAPRPVAAALSAPAIAATSAAQAQAATPAPPALLTAPPAPPRASLAALRQAALGAHSAEQQARVRKLAEQASSDALNAVASRSYPSAQQARAAGTALQVALRFRQVSEKLEVVAWKCNAFNCVHDMPGGMSSCSDPSRGGVPITRVITDVTDASTEFNV